MMVLGLRACVRKETHQTNGASGKGGGEEQIEDGERLPGRASVLGLEWRPEHGGDGVL
jgi:hypothetical protein